MWADDDRCEAIVRSAWDSVEGGDVVTSCVSKVDRCMSSLVKWNAEEFSNVHKQIQATQLKLQSPQSIEDRRLLLEELMS